MKNILLYSLFLSIATLFSSCNSKEDANTLKIAASGTPHAEILEYIKPKLEEKGVSLEIIVIDDYQIPNRALADGEVDANFFQHAPFLEAQIEQFGYSISPLTAVHVEPMGLYANEIKALSALKQGATIAIPSDPANQARALLLLEKNKLIGLSRHDIKATVLDITDNEKAFIFLEIDAPLLARTLVDADLAAINTNFALQAGLSPIKDALALESSDSHFVNLVAIRTEDEDNEKLQVLKEVITSPDTGAFIEGTYKGAITQAIQSP